MKNVYALSLLILMCILNVFIFTMGSTGSSPVFAADSSYARVKDNVYLYKSAIAGTAYSNIYFVIPSTYFVELINSADNTFYRASYMNILGFVKKSDVTPVTGTPKTPYANNISFRVFASDGTAINGTALRSAPSTLTGISQIAGTLPVEIGSGYTGIQYIGQIQGEESIAGKGTVWYYCTYPNGTQNLYGYVYSGYTDSLTSIATNTEVLASAPDPYAGLEYISAIQHDEVYQILLICGVCLAAAGAMFMFFMPFKFKTKNLKLSFNKLKNNVNKKEILLYDDKEL